MDTKVIKQPSQVSRTFLETTLGFGRPACNNAVSALFKSNEGALRFATNNSEFQANINDLSRAQWDKIHHNESGMVQLELSAQSISAAQRQVDKELNAIGLSLDAFFTPEDKALLVKIERKFNDFVEVFKSTVDKNADVVSSFVVKRVPDQNQWTATVRLAVFGEDESVYAQFSFSQIVRNYSILIRNDQIRAARDAVLAYFSQFKAHTAPFIEYGPVSITGKMAHFLVHNLNYSEKVIYEQYYKEVQDNTAMFKSPLSRESFSSVVPYDALTDTQRELLTASVSIMRLYIRTMLADNVAESQKA